MSLNHLVSPSLARQLKFYTNVSQVNEDGSVIDFQLPSNGSLGQTLTSNGTGNVFWNTVPLQPFNPEIEETIYPANANIDIGTLNKPFRKLYIQDQTIELINTTDPLKSGALSIDNGNISLSTNSNTANLSIGYLAGINANVNSVNLGTESGSNSGGNNCNVGFYAGRKNCASGVVSLGTQAHQNNAKDRSVAIGFLAGADLVETGKCGIASIAIGCRSGIETIEDNSIIINATDANLNNTVPSSFVVKPVRNLSTYSKILAYNTSSGEIFSSDEKNTLNPVVIATPQVEKNIETKNDNSNAFVVLQPTIGDTELLGGVIRVNNTDKKENTELSSSSLQVSVNEDPVFKDATFNENGLQFTYNDATYNNYGYFLNTIGNIPRAELTQISGGVTKSGFLDCNEMKIYELETAPPKETIIDKTGLTHTSTYPFLPFPDIINTISLRPEPSFNNFPRLLLKTIFTTIELKTAIDVNKFTIYEGGDTYANINKSSVSFTEPSNIQNGNYGRTLMSIIDDQTTNTQLSSQITLRDVANPNIFTNLTRTSTRINNDTVSNTQSAFQIAMNDIGNPNINSTLTRVNLNIRSSATINNLIDSESIAITDTTQGQGLLENNLISFTNNTETLSSSLTRTNLEIKDITLDPQIITANLSKTDLIFSNGTTNNTGTLSSSKVEFKDTTSTTSNLTKSQLTLSNSTGANSVSSSLISIIDTSANRTTVETTGIKVYTPADTVNAKSTVNQQGVSVITTANSSSLTETTLEIKNAGLTPEFSTLTQNGLIVNSPVNNCVSALSSTTFNMNDIAVTHGVAISKDQIYQITASQLISVLTAQHLQFYKITDLVNPHIVVDNNGLSGGLNKDLTISVSGTGHMILSGLSNFSSPPSLPAGTLYTHNQGGHKVLAIV